jgi:hypothetical protein
LKEESSGKKKGGKGKGGKGKKGKGKEEKEVKTAQEEEGEEEGEMTVLNEIWPKKEPLGLTKWSVVFLSPYSPKCCMGPPGHGTWIADRT